MRFSIAQSNITKRELKFAVCRASAHAGCVKAISKTVSNIAAWRARSHAPYWVVIGHAHAQAKCNIHYTIVQ
eukprot:scaffold132853_cov31-Tisochrysis_lutea.AAC.3